MDATLVLNSGYAFYTLITVIYLLLTVVLWQCSKGRTGGPNLPPGPVGLPIFGNLLDIKKNLPNGPSLFSQWAREFGDIYSLRLGQYNAVVINSYDLLREALVKHKDITSDRATNVLFVKWTTGHRGIIQNNGPAWQTSRRATLRMLRNLGMGKNSLESRIQAEAAAVVELMVQQDGKPFSPKFMLHSAFSNVLCSLIFGKRYDYDDEDFQFIAHHLDRLFSAGGFKNPEMFIPALMPLVPLTNMPFCKVGLSFLTIRSHLKRKIKQQRKQLNNDCGEPNFIKNCLKENFYDNDDALLDILFDLFIAGSETSTTLAHWSLLYFVNYPDVQRKCQQEIKEVLGPTRSPDMVDRKNMPYMQAVINELMRISNIAPLAVTHRFASDIEMAGFSIPKDTLLLPNIHFIHMDPDYWTNPDHFCPERWIDADGTIIQHEQFAPFSLGPRECMGKSMAQQEMFIILVTLLQNFTFLPENPDNPPKLEGTLGFTYGPNDYSMIAKRNMW